MENFSKLFSKKIGRGSFALNFLIVLVSVSLLVMSWGSTDMNIDNINPFGGIVLLIGFSCMLLFVIQRLNDLEWSKWYLILYLIPIVSFFFFIALLGRKREETATNSDLKNKLFYKTQQPNKLPKKKKMGEKEEDEFNKENNEINYCTSCGAKREKDAKFCSSCGESLI